MWQSREPFEHVDDAVASRTQLDDLSSHRGLKLWLN
jgi:hypothetical protein